MDNKSKQHSEVEIGICCKCEELIGYDFRQKELLKIALTHPSYNHEVSGLHDNQRLEFLGDSVLSIVIAEKLYQDYPEANEGRVDPKKGNLICGAALVKIGKSLKLGDFIFMSKSEKRSGVLLETPLWKMLLKQLLEQYISMVAGRLLEKRSLNGRMNYFPMLK